MSADAPKSPGSAPADRKAKPGRPQGRLFVISAPSGAGKSTLCRLLRERLPELRYSISYTTRPPREGEVDGVDYHFIDPATFKAGIAEGRWVEWARVHGHYYGTSSIAIAQTLAQGHDLLLDIDVQGAAQLAARYPDAVTIFIMPPSMGVLRQRLEKRGTDDPQVIALRLRNAREEMAARLQYHYTVVNDRLDQAVDRLAAIMAPRDRRGPGGD
jgi:guanylate kinase